MLSGLEPTLIKRKLETSKTPHAKPAYGHAKPNLRIDSGPLCRGKVKTRRLPDRAGAGATEGCGAARQERRREEWSVEERMTKEAQ